MFTGIIQTMGTVTQLTDQGSRRLVVQPMTPFADVIVGESIAVDGCCLTVVAANPFGLSFDATTETLKRTTIGQLEVSDKVNLERSLCANDRLGGHFVYGHVDAIGTIASAKPKESAVYMTVVAPHDVVRLCVPRGSITVSGVSLTVTATDTDTFTVALIPHTLAVTTLDGLGVGDMVNLEADMIARFVEKLVQNTPR